ncbi:MAG TPA: ABC transporter permease, partial [Gemmatimonadaceae bacterium]|nr:ABC transporter permease [Gemmatimonadaceae bacterium]
TGRVVRRVLLPDVDWTSGPVDGHVFAFSLVVALLTGIVIGVLPAWRAGSGDMIVALKAGARDGGGNRSIVRRALMVAQASLAMLLLVGAGLFVRSLERVRGLDLGVQPDRVVMVSPRRLAIPAQATASDRATEEQRRRDFAREAVDRLAATPQVEHAAVTIGLPFGNSASVTLRVPGWDSLPRLNGNDGADPGISAVSAGYFATVGTRLVQGRVFTNADRAGSEPVAIVSATMAATLWPGRSPLDRCIRVGGDAHPCSRVVGVVQDARRNQIHEDPSMHYYVPIGQEVSIDGTQIVVRPRGDAAAALPALKAAIRQIDPTIRYVDATVLQDRVEPQARSWRLGAMMFTLFAVLAVVVAAVGTFGVVVYLVEQRKHEIGVRVALGAQGGHVVAIVMRGAVATTLAGVVLGAVLALAGGRFVQPLLFETSARDPIVIGSVSMLLVLVASIASGVPALRARYVDPMLTLRDD